MLWIFQVTLFIFVVKFVMLAVGIFLLHQEETNRRNLIWSYLSLVLSFIGIVLLIVGIQRIDGNPQYPSSVVVTTPIPSVKVPITPQFETVADPLGTVSNMIN